MTRIEIGQDDYQFSAADAAATASINRVWSPFITPYTKIDTVTQTTIALKDREYILHMATVWFDGTTGYGREGINAELAILMPDNQQIAIAPRQVSGMGAWPLVAHFPGGLPLRWPLVVTTWMPSGIVENCYVHIRTLWRWQK